MQQKSEEELVKLLIRRVDEFAMSARSRNCLRNMGITYLLDLVQWSEREMLRIPYFGKKSLDEVKQIINSLGLVFCMRPSYRTNQEDDDFLWPTGGVAVEKYREKMRALGFE